MGLLDKKNKRLTQREMNGLEVISEPLLTSTESQIEKHVSFLDMLLRGENLRIEVIKHKEN